MEKSEFQKQVEELEGVPEYKSEIKKLFDYDIPIPEIKQDELDVMANVIDVEKDKQVKVFFQYTFKF